jgi:hypothetical protein
MPGSPFAITHAIKRRSETAAVTWCGSRLRLPSKPQSKRHGWPVTCTRCREEIDEALVLIEDTEARLRRLQQELNRLRAYEYPKGLD